MPFSSIQAICFVFLDTGKCPKGKERPYSHDPKLIAAAKAQPSGKGGKGKGRGKGSKSRANSPAAGDTSNIPCKFYPLGQRVKGEDCLCSHALKTAGVCVALPAQLNAHTTTKTNKVVSFAPERLLCSIVFCKVEHMLVGSAA